MSIRYAAERQTVERPDGARFDVLVNRAEVPLYTTKAAVANLYAGWPLLIGIAKNRGWRNWRWAVTVRQAPFAGYPNLVYDVFHDRAEAERRATELAQAIARGMTSWPADAEM